MTEEIRFDGTTKLKLTSDELTKLLAEFRIRYYGTFARDQPQIREPRSLYPLYDTPQPTPEFERIRKYLAKCHIHFRKMGMMRTPSFYLTGKSKLTVDTLSKLFQMNEQYGVRIVRKNWELFGVDYCPHHNRLAKIGDSLQRITPFCKNATLHARATFSFINKRPSTRTSESESLKGN